jgi:preprotein translocase subunit YajC
MENILTSLGALPMFLLMFLILYFVLIRPQMKEQKEKQLMIENLKKDNRVITRGGIVGKVIDFQGKNDQYVIIDNEAGSRLKLLKSSIVSLFEK